MWAPLGRKIATTSSSPGSGSLSTNLSANSRHIIFLRFWVFTPAAYPA